MWTGSLRRWSFPPRWSRAGRRCCRAPRRSPRLAAHAACCTTSASPAPGSQALGPDGGSFRCFPSGGGDAADDDVAVARVQVKFDRAVAGGGGRVGGEFVADPAVGRAGVDPGRDAGWDTDVDIGVAAFWPDRAAAHFPDANGPFGATRGH